MAITYSMDSLKHKLAEILDVIPRHSSVVYLDYPLYGNVGDLLIMKGTEAFFEAYGIKMRERWNAENFIPGRRIPKDAIIVCQGAAISATCTLTSSSSENGWSNITRTTGSSFCRSRFIMSMKKI
ncbi:polysaccharide pyruvyl transferase YvfF [Bacillus licheniformis]|nr:polysaccharide pyruvyl transferase YvfF [Bacillus licheniformis]